MVLFANLPKGTLRPMSKGIESDKLAMVLLWVCGGTFHTFLNALLQATHKSLTADPYKNHRGAP